MESGGIGQFIPLILIFVIFYFFLIRPQQKKVKEHKAMVESLKKGDKVVTSGGITGTIQRVIDNDKVEVDVSFDGYFPPSQEDGRDTFEFEDKFKISYQLTKKIRLYNLGEISKLQGKEFYKAKVGVEISL